MGYTFGLFGKLALVTAAVPYAWGDITGTVFEEARAITRSGLVDARAKFSRRTSFQRSAIEHWEVAVPWLKAETQIADGAGTRRI